MFRPILKKKNELDPETTKSLVKNARRGILSINGLEGYPYGIPLNYLYDENAGKIYFHGAKKGHKIEALSKNDKVCFTVLGEENIKDLDWAPYVKSAVIFGTCYRVSDKVKAMKILKDFAMKYYPSETMVMEEIEKNGDGVQIFEITIDHMTGKEVREN